MKRRCFSGAARLAMWTSIVTVGLMLLTICGCSASGPTNNDNPYSESSTVQEESTVPPLDDNQTELEPTSSELEESGLLAITITVDGHVFTAKFYENESAKTIATQLPFSLNMADYAGQEKGAQLSFPLPEATTETPSRVQEGELYLWSGNTLVLFYTTFPNSYPYVPIGYLEDATGLADGLGSGDVQVNFALANPEAQP